jgi:hypothetical protein
MGTSDSKGIAEIGIIVFYSLIYLRFQFIELIHNFFLLVLQVPYDTMTPLQAALGVRQVCSLFISGLKH